MNMITAKVNCIVRLRINSDGEGVRSVIFMQDCPVDCVWCCNPETRKGNNYKTLTAEQLYSYIERDVPYFLNSEGGITFSGGEPAAQAEFLRKFKDEYCRDFSVNIESSLYVSKKKLDLLIPVIDEWYTDFKLFDGIKHEKYTGVSNELIKDNFRYLSQKIDKSKIVVTYPMIPGINTDEDNIADMIGFLKSIGVYRIELHPYRKTNEKKHEKLGLEHMNLPEPENSEFERVKKIFFDEGFVLPDRRAVIEKDKCNYLKNIRQMLIERDGIPLTIPECTFTGRCKGTCDECEHELDVIMDFYRKG